MTTKLYHVKAETENLTISLGYYSGNQEDIREYCMSVHNCGYGLILEEVRIINIDAEMADKAYKTKQALEKAEKDLQQLKKQLNQFAR